MTTRDQKWSKLTMVTTVAAALFVLAACGSSSTPPAKSGSTTAPTRMVKIPGGTMTVATGGASYIFPMMSGSYFGVSNVQMIELMFRPLYWFGLGYTPDLNPGLSLADPPVYSNSGRTVTIKMKGYRWSNGETVDARDVLFWMNMVKADATSWGGYASGPGQYPGDITNVVANDRTDTVTLSLDAAYGSYWFTYNELSQITPLPIAWDITAVGAAPGSGGCSSASYASVVAPISASTGALTDVSASAKACASVYAFLSGKAEAGDLGTYSTNPLWQIVDGPFRLTSFNTISGAYSLVPNKKYSGLLKPSIDKLVITVFNTNSAEFNALKNKTLNIGGGNIALPLYKGKIWCGHRPCVGANNPQLAKNYNLVPVYDWGINYFALNFRNPAVAPIFKQLYIRQAMQSLVNQSKWTYLVGGYGQPGYGPVPVYPPTEFASRSESADPYPYSPSHAKALLSSHGWKVVPNGITTCVKPGAAANECGTDIAKGAQLSFTYLYNVAYGSPVREMASSWAQAGIKLLLEGKSSSAVVGAAFTPCTTSKTCTWEIAFWGGGWEYAPDIYPSGEEIFATGAGSNAGGYSDPTADRYIVATNQSSSLSVLYTYEDYLADQLPVIWVPDQVMSLSETGKNVCGWTPENVNPVLNWAPESLYFCRPAK